MDKRVLDGGDYMSDGNFNHWGSIANALPKATSQLVRKTAFDIVAGFQARAAVDTGFMKNSAYVVTSQESTYGQVQPTRKGAYLLPEVERPPDDQTAYAAVGANYTIFVELGTVHAPAQPAFYPAVDAVKPSFEAALARIEDALKDAAK